MHLNISNMGFLLKTRNVISGIKHICSNLENFRKIYKLKNKHLGERCFIVAMGPSLKIEDLNLIKEEFTLGCNKCYLAFSQTEWRPNYYFVADHLVASQNKDNIKEVAERITTIADKNIDLGFLSNNVLKVNSLRDSEFRIGFSSNLGLGFFSGSTVTYRMIQAAVYMGFSEIYILGLDFSYTLPNTTVNSSNEKIDSPVLVNQNEINHFHADYRKKGEAWTKPKPEIQKVAFSKAYDVCKRKKIKIINVSRKTKLKVFPIESLEKIL